jgi:hypothetical protein
VWIVGEAGRAAPRCAGTGRVGRSGAFAGTVRIQPPQSTRLLCSGCMRCRTWAGGRAPAGPRPLAASSCSAGRGGAGVVSFRVKRTRRSSQRTSKAHGLPLLVEHHANVHPLSTHAHTQRHTRTQIYTHAHLVETTSSKPWIHAAPPLCNRPPHHTPRHSRPTLLKSQTHTYIYIYRRACTYAWLPPPT